MQNPNEYICGFDQDGPTAATTARELLNAMLDAPHSRSVVESELGAPPADAQKPLELALAGAVILCGLITWMQTVSISASTAIRMELSITVQAQKNVQRRGHHSPGDKNRNQPDRALRTVIICDPRGVGKPRRASDGQACHRFRLRIDSPPWPSGSDGFRELRLHVIEKDSL
jgi:hypothetical protein